MPKLSDVRAFLLDIDGTLALGDHLLPGALAFLATLERTGRKWLYLTNNSSRSAEDTLLKIQKLGLPVTPEQVLTSGQSAFRHLRGLGHQRLYLMGTPSLQGEARAEGFELVAPEETPQAVLLGFDRTLTFEKLRQAHRLLHQGLPFFATHPDLVCPTADIPEPDVGSMLALFHASSGRRAVILGKPEPPMAAAALARLGLAPKECAMVGDRLYTDIAFAHRAEMQSVLVFSGETRPGTDYPEGQRPDIALPSIGDLIPLL